MFHKFAIIYKLKILNRFEQKISKILRNHAVGGAINTVKNIFIFKCIYCSRYQKYIHTLL